MKSQLIKGALALSATGLISIAMLEGYSPMPYIDGGGVPTDNFGNTHGVGKVKDVPGALAQLERNTTSAGQAVTRCITTAINQHQYDAFVSFAYNVGNNAFCNSTLVKKFNAGDSIGACNELRRWVYDNGKKVSGLVKRREKERELCLQN